MKGTKEFEDLQSDFEKYVNSKSCPIYIGAKIERAPKTAKHFYENGQLNALFNFYMAGYSNGRIQYMGE